MLDSFYEYGDFNNVNVSPESRTKEKSFSEREKLAMSGNQSNQFDSEEIGSFGKLQNSKEAVKCDSGEEKNNELSPKAQKKADKILKKQKAAEEKSEKKQKILEEKIRIAEEKRLANEKAKKIKEEAALKEKKYREYRKEYRKSNRIRFSIGLKLIGITSIILLVSLLGITYLVSFFVSKDTQNSAEDNNKTINTRTAADLENRFNSYVSSVNMFSDLIVTAKSDEIAEKETGIRFFDSNPDIAAIYFLNQDKSFLNKKFFISHEIDSGTFTSYIAQADSITQRVQNGETFVDNPSLFFGTSLLGMFYPVSKDEEKEVVLILFSSENLNENISSDKINVSFAVNNEGIILVHPDINQMKNAVDFSFNKLVELGKAESVDNLQKNYTDDEGVSYIGSIKRIQFGNCYLITEVKSDVILGAVNATQRRNLILTFSVLFLSILIMWAFAKSISSPLERLTAVTNEINKGNFNTDLFDSLKSSRKDEIGHLVKSTKDERDILNTVTSLTNEGVTKAIVRKQIDFEPHLKDITIFFSDIRGFTAISDGFNKRFGEKSAGEIIGFLNDYMSRMINCIKITGGNVDKFEGDAVMACWGVLRNDSLDYELWDDSDPLKSEKKKEHIRHTKIDALNAIRSSIAMRYALMKYNKDAKEFTEAHAGEPNAKYKPLIRIGAGLNSGRATVGFMGCLGKMEFTSIGDAVNLASRTESSNKPCGTDILITEDTYNLLKNEFIKNPSNNFKLSPKNEKYEIVVEMIPVSFEVKGKGQQHFYGVVNMPNFDIEEFFRVTEPDFIKDEDCAKSIGPDGPATLNEVRTLLGIPIPDFDKVNLNEEEAKVKAT